VSVRCTNRKGDGVVMGPILRHVAARAADARALPCLVRSPQPYHVI
jgi:hypothetical protein